MENKAVGFYKNLPDWSRGIISTVVVVGGVALVITAGVIGYNYFKKKVDTKDSEDVSNSAWDEYKKLLKSGQKLSFTESKYISTANTIKTSLDGCETYLGESDAYNAVIDCVKKPIDWYFLVKVFGARSVDNCGLGTGDTTYALPELLREQLGTPLTTTAFSQTYFNYLKEYLQKMGVEI